MNYLLLNQSSHRISTIESIVTKENHSDASYRIIMLTRNLKEYILEPTVDFDKIPEKLAYWSKRIWESAGE